MHREPDHGPDGETRGVTVYDWHGDGDPLHLAVEIKSYSCADATGVDNLDTLGQWQSPRRRGGMVSRADLTRREVSA